MAASVRRFGGTAAVAPEVVTSGVGFATVFDGNEIVLRGVNVQADASAAVFQSASALNANLLRIVCHWDQGEPTAPAGTGTNWASYTHSWDATYLEGIDAIVNWAAQNGIYVLIDSHQARWSPYFGGFSGVPMWYYTDARFAGGRYTPGTGSADRPTAVAKFWTAESEMSRGLYTAWMQMLVGRYSQFATVIGYEIFNEPNPGNLPGSVTAKTAVMRDWQVPVRDAIYALDSMRAIFFMHLGGGAGVGSADWKLWGDMPGHNMVLDVHSYFVGESTGAGAAAGQVGLDVHGDRWVPDDQTTHNNLRNSALGTSYSGSEVFHEAVHNVWRTKAWTAGIPMFIGEWGANQIDTGLRTYQTHFLTAAAKYGLSHTRWLLASGSGPTLNISAGTEAYIDLEDKLNPASGSYIAPGTTGI